MPAKKQPQELKGSHGKAELPPTYSDRTHKIAELAVQIMALVPRVPRDPRLGNLGLDESSWDADFEAARRRAEMLLDDIENQRGEIDAYQLFEEGLILSCEEISQIFKTANWKGLTSVEPVRRLMRRIDRQMEDHGEELLTLMPIVTDEVAKGVLYSLNEIASSEGVRKVFPDYMMRLNEFIASMHNPSIRNTKEEAFGDYLWFKAFSAWCIEKEGAGSNQVTKYRAHELFRFAVKCGWKEKNLLKPSKDVFGPFRPKIHPSRLDNFERFPYRESILSMPDIAP